MLLEIYNRWRDYLRARQLLVTVHIRLKRVENVGGTSVTWQDSNAITYLYVSHTERLECVRLMCLPPHHSMFAPCGPCLLKLSCYRCVFIVRAKSGRVRTWEPAFELVRVNFSFELASSSTCSSNS